MTLTAPLTEKNLKRFDRMSSNTRATVSSTHSNSTSTTDPAFPTRSRMNGILRPITSKPPVNLSIIQTQTNRDRESPEPDETEYQQFLSTVQLAANDFTLVVESSFALLKQYPEAVYRKTYNQPCNSFPKGVGFNNNLAQLQPGMIEALDMVDFDPFPIIDQLSGAVFFTAGHQFQATLPHLAGEWKGPKGVLSFSEAQAAYNGAAMVYGRNAAREFLEAPDAPGQSFVSTFTITSSGEVAILKMYAHYSVPSAANGGGLKYHQCLISSTNLATSYKTFCEGRKRLRNLQDYSKMAAENLRDELKAKWLAKDRGVDGAGSDDDNDEAGQDDDNDEGSDQDKHGDKDNAKTMDTGNSKANVKDMAKGKRKAESENKDEDDADERDDSLDIDADDGDAKHKRKAKALAKTQIRKSGTAHKKMRTE